MPMRTESEQERKPDPKRSRKLSLHKETIKNLKANGFPTNMAADFPTGCDCTDSCVPTTNEHYDG
jgi:hypothetical protein